MHSWIADERRCRQRYRALYRGTWRLFDELRVGHADTLRPPLPLYARMDVLITTNPAFRDWPDILPNASCVTALIDPLTHHVDIRLIEGRRYRHHKAEESRKDRRGYDSKP